MKIYVGNLSFKANEGDIEQLFNQHGEVDNVSIVLDRQTGRSRGFAFVEMKNDEQARAAIAALNGNEFDGRALTVNDARPRENRVGGGWGGGGYGGGGGGGGRGGSRGGGRDRW